MGNLIKLLGLATAVGVAGGAYLNGFIREKMSGNSGQEKVKKAKVQIVEIPDGMDVKDAVILVKKRQQLHD